MYNLLKDTLDERSTESKRLVSCGLGKKWQAPLYRILLHYAYVIASDVQDLTLSTMRFQGIIIFYKKSACIYKAFVWRRPFPIGLPYLGHIREKKVYREIYLN